jgi:hypothetical protein
MSTIVRPTGASATPTRVSENERTGRLLRYALMRMTTRTELIERKGALHFMRPGFLLITLFELASISISVLKFPGLQWRALPFEVFNAVAAFVCLWTMWTSRFETKWRETAFAFFFVVILAASYLSLVTGMTEPLFVSLMIVMFGAGSLVPWNQRWQAGLTLLCIAWFATNAIWMPDRPSDSLYKWLGLMAAAALALAGNARNQTQHGALVSSAKMAEEKPLYNSANA